MRLPNVDLNLFVVFDTIYTERNLTRAAEVLHITQPAASNALARLRRTLNDDLFVRTPKGMAPTPVADNIIHRVREALQLMHTSLNEAYLFDPATSEKRFRISMNDMAEAILLPELERILEAEAPHINIESYYTGRRDLVKELAAGSLDLSIDVPVVEDRQVCHMPIMTDDYACLLRNEHLLAMGPLALDDYMGLGHILVSSRPAGAGHIDAALTALGRSRRIQLRVRHYLVAALIVTQTDLALTAPWKFLKQFDAAVLPLPLEVQPIEFHMYWHRSADGDQANSWLREKLLSAIR